MSAASTPAEAALARLYAAEAEREGASGRAQAAAFWWTQALVLALAAGDASVVRVASTRLRTQGDLD